MHKNKLKVFLQKEFNNLKDTGLFYRSLPDFKAFWNTQFNHCLFINPLSGKAVSAINNGRARKWFYVDLVLSRMAFLSYAQNKQL